MVNRVLKDLVALVTASMLLLDPTEGAAQASSDVEAAMIGFLTALNDLDGQKFRHSWDANATMFGAVASFATPPVGVSTTSLAKRLDGSALNTVWKEIFDEIRKRSGRSAPPYQKVQPQDMRIDLLGVDAAVVTFHLGNSGGVSRRTFVWRRSEEGWKIVHMHASMISSVR